MTLCPKFSFFSVLFWISVIQIVVFITELFIGGISPKSFLAANSDTLESMGQKVLYHLSVSFLTSARFIFLFSAICFNFYLGSLCNEI